MPNGGAVVAFVLVGLHLLLLHLLLLLLLLLVVNKKKRKLWSAYVDDQEETNVEALLNNLRVRLADG